MTQGSKPAISRRTSRRVGYAVAIVCNAVLLVAVNNILDWGWFPWITEDLDDVLPIINASLIASIAANAVFVGYDGPRFKGIADLGLLSISVIATIRLLRVWPFDFSAYDFAWGTLCRWALGLAIFGSCVAILVQLTRLARMARGVADGTQQPGR